MKKTFCKNINLCCCMDNILRFLKGSNNDLGATLSCFRCLHSTSTVVIVICYVFCFDLQPIVPGNLDGMSKAV